jgi:hypothetical protein
MMRGVGVALCAVLSLSCGQEPAEQPSFAGTANHASSSESSRLSRVWGNHPGVDFRSQPREPGRATLSRADVFVNEDFPGFTLSDEANRVLRVEVEGAMLVRPEFIGTFLLYQRALALRSGARADVALRASATGLEDYVYLERKPVEPLVRYTVRTERIYGLRLTHDVLEFLDENGAPRFRLGRAAVVGADGATTTAKVRVEGCAYDTGDRLPWTRHFVPPEKACTVSVTWEDSDVIYPAVYDPTWEVTGTTTYARDRHTSTLLESGRVLVAGGSETFGGTLIPVAEAFDPATKTWAVAGALMTPRVEHAAS